MRECRVLWVPDQVLSSRGVQNVEGANELIAQWLAAGWRVLGVAPGTGGQTNTGLFITFWR